MSTTDRPANRLIDETSPYLLQHAYNPVDWFAWSEQALHKARQEEKPIFLSIGYSACHWCHVMERECFESEPIAEIMNRHFINIKVDREERPDLDQIYMGALQAMTRQGGWPMSMFLTPQLQPIFGGTYFPPEDRMGMTGFPRLLEAVAEAWSSRREAILESAQGLTRELSETMILPKGSGEFSTKMIETAVDGIVRGFDPHNGGFGSAPKFPHAMVVRFLLHHSRRTGQQRSQRVALVTLEKMAGGGIFDHLGGGFARYSTDERWLVPHFEKMLYDNALLLHAYVEAFQLTGDEEFAEVAHRIVDYILGRMTSPEGGFYATEDADSEGVEGKYYVWSLDEIVEVLGPDRAKIFAACYDVTEAGNWEGQSILNRPKSWSELTEELGISEEVLRQQLQDDRERLLVRREARVAPGCDTKVLTSLNGLMIAALADSAHAIDRPDALLAAERAAAFLLDHCRTVDGHLLHSYKDGRARFNGYLDDYSHLIDGLTRLFEVTGTNRWLSAATDLTDRMLAEFLDETDGGFYYTGTNHESLIYRQKEGDDNATPSGNAMAATALLRLSRLLNRDDYRMIARGALQAVQRIIERAPMAAGQSLIALELLLTPSREIAIVPGSDDQRVPMLSTIRRHLLPDAVLAVANPADPAQIELLANRSARDDRTTAYLCKAYQCQEPVTLVDDLAQQLAELTPTRSPRDGHLKP